MGEGSNDEWGDAGKDWEWDDGTDEEAEKKNKEEKEKNEQEELERRRLKEKEEEEERKKKEEEEAARKAAEEEEILEEARKAKEAEAAAVRETLGEDDRIKFDEMVRALKLQTLTVFVFIIVYCAGWKRDAAQPDHALLHDRRHGGEGEAGD